ncbi:DUF6913 domain-containing protein [Planktosalinus lacus]|uniref:Uncharacterized protein n=1 Tax=Planktosalinus lacus TaxID=1526573 RepID=A0A8J2VA88_9FLAO|nr:hypothetical protein [Planktosalinus lacus]GGD91445.1 hypothetical protein GCM10011312_14030 [Planktosalinus lacus]
MNLKTVKKYFLKKQIEKHLKSGFSKQQTANFKTVGVLVNAEEFEDVDSFSSLIQSLEILNKDLKLIIYKEEKKNLPTLEQNKFSSKDYSWNGILTKPAIIEFLDREYDLFIGYYSNKNSYLDFVSSRAKAHLKVGVEGANSQIFDLIFKIPVKDYSLFEHELAKYVNIFQNKKTAV